jgi:nucleotide sugar dehydrogenase
MRSKNDDMNAGNGDMEKNQRPVVCIQGLGFVGSAMAVAVASAIDEDQSPCFDVIGVELPNDIGIEKVSAINSGELPLQASDIKLENAHHRVVEQGNLTATTDSGVYSRADIVVIDIHLDVHISDGSPPTVNFSGFRNAIASIGKVIAPGALILVETTVPPGTCSEVVVPELAKQLERRGLDANSVMVAHSYERVMPGKDYFDSIANFWRVYAGTTAEAADATEAFLSKVINVKEFPLTRLQSTIASESAKILENTYRAVNIAFIDEWGRFAEQAGIDLFEVINAIRVRPTHCNIRQPGFGVGGYCLTKDPHLVDIGARELLNLDNVQFPFSKKAVEINSLMPLVSVGKLKKLLGGDFKGKKIALLGVSYRQDVGDTRYSPSEIFLCEVEKEGGVVIPHDPLVEEWMEIGRTITADLPDPRELDAVVFAVQHDEYTELDIPRWLQGARPVIFDTNHVLTTRQAHEIQAAGCVLEFIGKGV